MEEFRGSYPHLENCTQIIEENNGVALKLLFDTTRHQYLCDHVFGGMCFVPATMIMEILMESALWYTKRILKKEEFISVGLNNINIERALAIEPNSSLEAIIDFVSIAEINEQIIISIKIYSERKSSKGDKIGTRVNTTAQVLLAKEYSTCPEIEISNDIKENYFIPKDLFYNNYFPNLGYFFNSSTGNFAYAKDSNAFLGTYNCSGKEAQFIKDTDAVFISSPLGNDSCLQYAVFFSRILAIQGRLPIGGKEFTIFKKHPLEGDVKVFIKCLHIDEELMIFDFYSFDRESLIVAGKEFRVKKSPYHKEFIREEFFSLMNQYKRDVL